MPYQRYPFPYNNYPRQNRPDPRYMRSDDHGPEPFVVNIEEVTLRNNAFRSTLWTGDHLQLTLMSIRPGEDIGLELHPDLDQFLRIEEGQGMVKMGSRKDYLDYQRKVQPGFAIIVPAGTWHNLINTGNRPVKLYSIYAPPQHPPGTLQSDQSDCRSRRKNVRPLTHSKQAF